MMNAAKLAVLIDADNAQPGIVESPLVEVARYGTAHVKRAYGDWTGTSLRGWKDQLLKQLIQPMQQFAYTKGKNATDAAMVIDAMDLFYTERFDGCCIVSSDSAAPRFWPDTVRVRGTQNAQANRRDVRRTHLHGKPLHPQHPTGCGRGAATGCSRQVERPWGGGLAA
ncbi:NYN domain-containing protein [Streptomyces rubiginosohelvolus]